MSTGDVSIQRPRDARLAGAGPAARAWSRAAPGWSSASWRPLVGRRAVLPVVPGRLLFWLGIALGCLACVMLHHLVGGVWGFLIRRPLEAATMTLPLMALLFLPLALGCRLYPWADRRASRRRARSSSTRPPT